MNNFIEVCVLSSTVFDEKLSCVGYQFEVNAAHVEILFHFAPDTYALGYIYILTCVGTCLLGAKDIKEKTLFLSGKYHLYSIVFFGDGLTT